MMDLRLLGPVEVWTPGLLIDAGPPRQRSVLAALAVDVGRPVMVETVIDRVWGEAPPDRVRDLLYVYISRIRKMIGEAGEGTRVRLVRRSGGYALDMAPDSVDIHRFRRLKGQAGDPQCPDDRRAILLRQTLDLWRGAPLADLPGEWAAQVRTGWHQQRLDAVGAWAQVELRLGNAGAVVGPLTDLIAEYPLAEPLVAALMTALHAAGRGADALDCYATTRHRLAEQLGADPGPELQRLHQSILRGDLDQAVPTRISVSTTQAKPVPAQLPLEAPGFTGRADEIGQLDKILAEASPQPRSVVISAVSGTAGVGKTALAVHWAHRIADRFPDGQLYANLRGFDPAGSVESPAEVVRGFLEALDVPPARVPISLQAQVGLYRSLLAGRRVLIVLDNVRDAEQVRPLLPGAPGCLVVVTSRNQLSSLVANEGAAPMNLDLLSPAEARQMLVRRLGKDRVAAEPEAIDEIITGCARLPLALAIVAARAATHPGFPLTGLASELRDVKAGLDAFQGGDSLTDVRAVFSWSYRALSPEAARLFRLLGLHPGPDFSLPATASLAGVRVDRARPLLAELTYTHLVTEHTPGRYTFHDLLRVYASELTQALDIDDERHSATHRVFDHYLHTAHIAAQLLHPYRSQIEPPPCHPGVTREDLTDLRQALNWFTVEDAVILRFIRLADHGAPATQTWRLAWTLAEFLERRGHWHVWADIHQAALASARKQADRLGQGHLHMSLGRVYSRRGRVDDAEAHLRQALEVFDGLGDGAGQAETHMTFAAFFERQGQHRDALFHAQRGLDLFSEAGLRAAQGKALNAVGWHYARLGDHKEALAHCQRGLRLQQELGDHRAQSHTWDSLGYAHFHLGHHSVAMMCFQQALDLMRDLGDRYGEALTIDHLGDAHDRAGNAIAARLAWQLALDNFDELGYSPNAVQVRAKLAKLDDHHNMPNTGWQLIEPLGATETRPSDSSARVVTAAELIDGVGQDRAEDG
jgi:DNA-binding SARP family transcriptional activator/tetratricopeptide (TPR) repeat protein